MALAFVEIENKAGVIFEIKDNEFSLYNDIISRFNEVYNDLFDEYSDFRLYNNHIDYLIRLTENPNSDVLLSFHDFLQLVKVTNKNILVLGN